MGDHAWTVDVRYMHISNAGLTVPNPGINTVQVRFGFGKFLGRSSGLGGYLWLSTLDTHSSNDGDESGIGSDGIESRIDSQPVRLDISGSSLL